jgi:hypothetical protein
MKRWLLILVVFVISLTLLGNSQASIDGIYLKYYPKHSELKQALVLNSPKSLGHIVILPDEPFDQIEAASIISRVDNLPSTLLEKVHEHHIKLKLFLGKLTDNPTAQHLRGIIPRGYQGNTTWDDVPGIGGSKTVLVKIGHSEQGMGHGSVNLELHELAHSIDRYVYQEIRYNQEFLSIWKEEKRKLFENRPYFLTFPEEYFAEAFAMYYIGGAPRRHLKSTAPKTYEFMKTLD